MEIILKTRKLIEAGKFNETDFTYDHFRHTKYVVPAEKIKLNLIIKWLVTHQGKKVLDLGCYTGNISLPLAGLGYQVYGIDLDEDEIETCKKLNHFKNAKFEKIDFLKVNEKFDFIIMADVLEHVDNPSDYLKHAHKILNPSGSLILSIPNGYGPFELFLDIPMMWLRKLVNKQRRKGEYHVQFFTLKQLKSLYTRYFQFKGINSFLFLNIYRPINRIAWLSLIDYLIVKHLPIAMSSRWLIYLQKK